jgi:hypothetical protein
VKKFSTSAEFKECCAIVLPENLALNDAKGLVMCDNIW